MFTPIDERLIDPSIDDLATLLDRATRKVNGRMRQRRVEKDKIDWRRFIRRNAKKREGHQTYVGGRGHAPAARVNVAWWTDPLGRKHWRVVGRRTDWNDQWRREHPMESHTLWHVYPDRLMIRTIENREELIALCPCGEAGPLSAIRWLGTSCGPCHDRFEEGLSLPGLELPIKLTTQSRGIRQMAFPSEGQLVSSDLSGRLFLWDINSGERKELLNRRGAFFNHLVVASAGPIATTTTQQNQILVGDLTEEPFVWREVSLRCGYIHQMVFSPNGRSLILLASRGVFRIDPHAPDGAPRQILQNRRIANLTFLDEGATVMVRDFGEGLLRMDLETEVGTMMRDQEHLQQAYEDDFFELDLNNEFIAEAIVRSRDGEWIVCVAGWGDSPVVHLYHVPTDRWLPLHSNQENTPATALAFTKEGELVTMTGDTILELWDVKRRVRLGTLQMDIVIRSMPLAFSPDGHLVAAPADHEGSIRVWPWRELLLG